MAAPIMVRNTHTGPTVFSNNDVKVEWAGYGDPFGGDVQPVPETLFNDPNFYRAMNSGLFEKITDEGVIEEQARLQREQYQTAQAAKKNAGKSLLDETPDQDILVLNCLGDNPKGGICGEGVNIRSKDRAEVPPLCPRHQRLRSQFIAEETGRVVQGKPEVAWQRVTMAPRERQQQD